MPRVTCRCGTTMRVPEDGPDRVDCTKCGAKIRVRRRETGGEPDGFVRFECPCGRRLKVRVPPEGAPVAGRCPDCGRVVPVPTGAEATMSAGSASNLDAATQELSKEDLAKLDQWAKERLAKSGGVPVTASSSAVASSPAGVRTEAGLRVCPQCGRPLHLSATTCRDCGAAVPRR